MPHFSRIPRMKIPERGLHPVSYAVMIYAGYHNAIDFAQVGFPVPGALHDRQCRFVREQARDVPWTPEHGLAGTVWIDSSNIPDQYAGYRYWKPMIIGLLANVFHKASPFLKGAALRDHSDVPQLAHWHHT